MQYRISKSNYGKFYAAVIQKTLSDCIYNEGTRKKSKQQTEQLNSQAATNTTSSISFD